MSSTPLTRAASAITAFLFIGLLAYVGYAGFKPGGWWNPAASPTATSTPMTGTTAPTSTAPEAIPFAATGNLIRNNPGLVPDVWRLAFETPGAPAQSVQLAFDATSTCVTNGVSGYCMPDAFTQGARVTLEGMKADSVVTVTKLTIEAAERADVRVTAPQPNVVIQNPLHVEGEARGSWYFEGSFPVRIVNANGKELGSVPAQAKGDWMTDAFVPFAATLAFATPMTDTGTLILEKDNPSGLAENAAEVRIPIRFNRQERVVNLFFYDAAKDQDASGNIRCSSQGLVAVERNISLTATPIQDAINLLLRESLTPEEEARGLSTSFPLPGLTLTGASLVNGTLTLGFSDPQHQTSGGACRVGILRAEIEATAKQFPGVNAVTFLPEDLFQP